MKNKIIKKLPLLIMLVLVISLIVPSFGSNSEAASLNRLQFNTIVLSKGYKQNQLLLINQKDKTSSAKWTSSNKKVATVNNLGEITAIKAGKTTITAKYKNKKYTCAVNVINNKTLYEDDHVKIQIKCIRQFNSSSKISAEQNDISGFKDILYDVYNKTNENLSIGFSTTPSFNNSKLKALSKTKFTGSYSLNPSENTLIMFTVGRSGSASAIPYNISKIKTTTQRIKLVKFTGVSESGEYQYQTIKNITLKNKKIK